MKVVWVSVWVSVVYGADLNEVFPGWENGRTYSGSMNDELQERFLEDIQIRQEQQRQRKLCERARTMLSDRTKMTSSDWEWVRCCRDEPCLQDVLPLVIDASFKDLSGQSFVQWLINTDALLKQTKRCVAVFLNNNYLSNEDLGLLRNFIDGNASWKARLIYLNVHANRFTVDAKATVEAILNACSQDVVGFM